MTEVTYEEMAEEEKAELDFIEFDYDELHFKCFNGGMVVYKDGKKIGQCLCRQKKI